MAGQNLVGMNMIMAIFQHKLPSALKSHCMLLHSYVMNSQMHDTPILWLHLSLSHHCCFNCCGHCCNHSHCNDLHCFVHHCLFLHLTLWPECLFVTASMLFNVDNFHFMLDKLCCLHCLWCHCHRFPFWFQIILGDISRAFLPSHQSYLGSDFIFEHLIFCLRT